MGSEMIHMAVLGSGSAGNSTLIQNEETTILVDAGLSAKQVRLRMESLGVSVDDLDAVLLTHEHSDHAKGVKVLLKGKNTPVYANALTKEFLEQTFNGVRWKVFQNGSEFSVGGFSIKSFPVPHDAQEPVGYVIECVEGRVGVLTDAGYVTNVIRQSLQGLDGLFMEANYDEGLLEADLKRPWAIKQRISSRHGHLSNEQAAELYAEVACESLQHLVIGHLSSDCNTSKHVNEAFRKECQSKGVNLPQKFICASQEKPTEWLTFGKRVLPTLGECEENGQGVLFVD